jgi:hypothetical protein
MIALITLLGATIKNHNNLVRKNYKKHTHPILLKIIIVDEIIIIKIYKKENNVSSPLKFYPMIHMGHPVIFDPSRNSFCQF